MDGSLASYHATDGVGEREELVAPVLIHSPTFQNPKRIRTKLPPFLSTSLKVTGDEDSEPEWIL